MPTMTVAAEPIGGAGPSTKKPQKIFKGLRRKQIRKLKKCLETVQNQDNAAETKGFAVGYQPVLFRVRSGNAADTAVKRLISRCNEALNQTA